MTIPLVNSQTIPRAGRGWRFVPVLTILFACFPTAKNGAAQVTSIEPTDPGHEFAIAKDLLAGVDDRAPVRSADQNYYEYRAYHYLLAQAHKTPPAWLAEHARGDLTFAHLFEEPASYRGELIHVQGKLRRLRRLEPTCLSAEQGIADIYEGWIYSDQYFNNPFCVVASERGSTLQIGEKLDSRVSFDGYFFKRYRYKAADGWRDAPLLIGRAIAPQPSAEMPSESLGSFSQAALPGFLTVIAATGLLCVALALWFRRGDREVRSRIEAVRTATFSGLRHARQETDDGTRTFE